MSKLMRKDIMSEKTFNEKLKNKYPSCEMSNKTLDMILHTIDEDDEENRDNDLVANKYELHELLGKGSFGLVYLATDKTKYEYAIKFEDISDYKKHLLKENYVYESLKGSKNFPKKYYYGLHKSSRVLVMERLGASLKSLYTNNNCIFNTNTISNIAVQILYRLQELHNKGWLHQDIKPENILIDNLNGQKLYLVDYGTSGYWWDNETNSHVIYQQSKKIVGTARYSCIANHQGYIQSRKDDLESLGYVLLYLIMGRLPWQGVRAPDFRTKWKKIKRIKIRTNIYNLCETLPECFTLYFKYLETLSFTQSPDYSYLRYIFRKYIETDFYWTKTKK